MARTLLCQTVTGRSMAELLAGRDAAHGADMVELRVDGVPDIDIPELLAGRTRPIVVTCRPAWEGGRFDGSEEARRILLKYALDCGAEFVDFEWREGLEDQIRHDIRRDPMRVVVSSHDFDGVPQDLPHRVRAMRQTGAAVIKIAITANRLSDTLPLLDIARDGDAVVIGMGDAGISTRLLASRFGSRWTYCGQGVAPGQLPVERMIDEFRFRQIGPDTSLYGVVGTNAMHSLSPTMQNAAFAAAGCDAVYVPLRAADFDDFLVFANRLGFTGASVTIPFKRDALAAAAGVDDLTRAVGAANTLKRINGEEWVATNTDVAGFLDPLEATYPGTLKDARASVLGAGGAARAVVVALTSRGAHVTVHARRAEQAREVAESLGAETGAWPPESGSWDVLVNTTPLGGHSYPDESPLPHGPFSGRLVYDLTYGGGESRLLRDARAAGCVTIDGLPMLVAQAERQFEWWTGSRPDPGVMLGAALKAGEALTQTRKVDVDQKGARRPGPVDPA